MVHCDRSELLVRLLQVIATIIRCKIVGRNSLVSLVCQVPCYVTCGLVVTCTLFCNLYLVM